MATPKVTVRLDQGTLERLNGLAQQLGKTKSEIAREAVRLYHQRHVLGIRGDGEQPEPISPTFPA
jgi:predicted transcriptional regulator